jgi:hypothetical protein
MDEDLTSMSRERLIDEVQKLPVAFALIETAPAMSSAGITPRCGPCFRRNRIPFRSCPNGRNSSADASGAVSRSTSRHPTRHALLGHTIAETPTYVRRPLRCLARLLPPL